MDSIRASMRESLRASQMRSEAPNLDDGTPAPASIAPARRGPTMNPLRMGSQRNVPAVEIADLPYGADIDAARDAGDTDAVKQIYTTFEREKRKDEGLATRATRHVPKLSFDVPDATDCITEECMAVTCCLPAYALVALYISRHTS